jgi:Reverse transcriptase (RNA-dependent DNA polymerase)
MNHIFKPYLRRFVLVFFDDVLIYSKDLSFHVDHLKLVMQKLVEHQLSAKWSKCAFGVTIVEYLGHVINANGVSIDLQKIMAIQLLRYCMFYGFLGVSRDLEINRLKVRELFVRRHVRLI